MVDQSVPISPTRIRYAPQRLPQAIPGRVAARHRRTRASADALKTIDVTLLAM